MASNDDLDEVVKEGNGEVVCPFKTCAARGLDLALKEVGQVGIAEKKGAIYSALPIVQFGNGVHILGMLSIIAFVGLWFLRGSELFFVNSIFFLVFSGLWLLSGGWRRRREK